MKELPRHWYAGDFDDSAWRTLRSGLSWEEQGVDHHGFGWYRQKLLIPQDYRGSALVLTLAPIPSDDDIYVNGVHVGGIRGEYKYANLLQRVYTIPATVLRYGQENTIAIRVWGGNLTFIGSKSGPGCWPYTAELSSYRIAAREQGSEDSAERNIELFDLSEAQRGKPFELVFRFPKEILNNGAGQMNYALTDYYGGSIGAGVTLVKVGNDGIARGVVNIDPEMSQAIYLGGRFKADVVVSNDGGSPLYRNSTEVDHLSFASRDSQPLPPLAEAEEDTPYGKLKLIDEIDSSQSLAEERHPYLESSFDKAQMFKTPGSPVKVMVNEILGKKAGKAKMAGSHTASDAENFDPTQPICFASNIPKTSRASRPVEVQVGQNFMDIGWKKRSWGR